MKIKRLLLICIAFIVSTVFLYAADPKDPAETNVEFSGGNNVSLKGYLATPPGKGPFPGVLMIHEWWGLNRDIQKLADILSSEGYVVLAADAYRGKVGKTANEALNLVRNTPQQQIRKDLDAALSYLTSLENVDASRIASLGFCFGGTQSMYMGTRNPSLAAVVIFYGSGPITDPAHLGNIDQAGPVLGIFGENDGNIPVNQVKAFEAALEQKGVSHTITIYPGVGHAFVSSETYNNGGTAQKAWNQTLDFLEKNIKHPEK
ncbi:MAG: dienelactone hydrolase family protein [Spirochaetales bacterium]|nr:dienelactone hydrolase family protein [Spirochaetales bacterium]